MKMREADAPALVAHFQKEVLGQLPGRRASACLAIPYLTPGSWPTPPAMAARYRIPLLNQVAVLGSPPAARPLRGVPGAADFLVRNQEQLLAVARDDLAALEGWQSVVQAGQVEFDSRYRREYLTSEKFRGFDEALVRLLDLLELPGVGKVVSGTLWVLRTPYRLLTRLVGKAMSRPGRRLPCRNSRCSKRR